MEVISIGTSPPGGKASPSHTWSARACTLSCQGGMPRHWPLLDVPQGAILRISESSVSGAGRVQASSCGNTLARARELSSSQHMPQKARDRPSGRLFDLERVRFLTLWCP